MTVPTYEGIAAAADAVRLYMLTAPKTKIPEEVKKKVNPHVGTGSSPVDLVVNFTEAVYANADSVQDEAKEIASGCAILAEGYGFHGMNEKARGSKIASILS